jgi:uncharacterized membrane protein YtjA (UPF0391 family)
MAADLHCSTAASISSRATDSSAARFHLRRCRVLYWAFVFLIVAIVSALLGFTTIAGASIVIAKFLFGLFIVLFIIFLIIGLAVGRKVL